jgi:hypothetical protein
MAIEQYGSIPLIPKENRNSKQAYAAVVAIAALTATVGK